MTLKTPNHPALHDISDQPALPRRRLLGAAMLGLVLASQPACAGWRDLLDSVTDVLQDNPQALGALSESEVVDGLREALATGTHNAILSLGREDGFLANNAVKIPLPEPLAGAEKTLGKLGLGHLSDDFRLRMNRAAEAAVPDAADIFSGAIRALSIEDAMNILNGPDDAATRYFRDKTADALTSRLRPLIESATDQAGVTQSYKSLARQAGPLMSLMGGEASDLDGYVTRKALDGLFTTIASEEKKIRDNPAARTSDILKRVFGDR